MASSADPASPARRRLVRGSLGALLAMPLATTCRPLAPSPRWESWQVLKDSSLSADGRMIDRSHADLRTTSEGQSYALFFALVDGDQPLFDRILQWTQDNLAAGDMAARLPGWLWGRHADGGWRLLDNNPASDSDLWLAYTLLQAARLWRKPALVRIANGMLAQVVQREIVHPPGLGPMLLPGPQGFVERDHWRFNPSYLPMPLLRCFAAHDPSGPWRALAANTLRMLRATAPHGFVPDWVAWRGEGFAIDPVKGAVGSYDAIRTYLWAGLTDPGDPLCRPMLSALHGPLPLLEAGAPMPETVDCASGKTQGDGPYGFQAAALPYLRAQRRHRRAAAMRAALPTPAQQRAQAPAYYSHMLSLFGAGAYDGRYRFAADGALQPAWAAKRR